MAEFFREYWFIFMLLLCPLMHLFMHRGHGGHGSHNHQGGHCDNHDNNGNRNNSAAPHEKDRK